MKRLLLYACVLFGLALPGRLAVGKEKDASASSKSGSAAAAADTTPADAKKDGPKKDSPKKDTSKRSDAKQSDSKQPAAKTADAKNVGAKKTDDKKIATKDDDSKKASDKTVSNKKDDKKSVAKKTDKTESASDEKQSTRGKKKAKETKKADVVWLTLRGEYPEGPIPLNLFGDLKPSLDSLIQRMTNAAEDPSVAAVVLQIENLSIGMGKVHEIRGAIDKIRKAGKPTVALLGSADTREYLLASQCDQVVMAPSGMLVLPGVHAEMVFYKGLLDKIGVEAEFLQQGKYKGAGEPLTRNKMSPALRESMEAIVDDTYGYLAETLAERRHTADYRIKTLMDEGLFSASAAQKAGLIDDMLYEDQIPDRLRKQLKADEVNVVRNYKKKKVQTDFSGLSGMMKVMEMMFGGAKTGEKPSQQKKIAVIYAVGAIVEGKASSDLFGEEAVSSSTLVAALRTAADDPKVAAVVLRVNSPGGSAVGSDLIWREVVRMKKPVIASMGDLAGSGGYYIAMGADKILASPATITGSIGVIGGRVAMRKLYDKIGLTTDVISRGRISSVLSSTDPFTPEERKAWSNMLEETYRQFVGKAAQGRKMPYKELDQLAQGRVYTGRMAVKNRLVDGLGTLQDAIAEAKKAAKIKPDEKVDVLILPQPKSFVEQLFGDANLSGDLDSILPGCGQLLRQTRLLAEIFREPAATLMPCRVELK